MGVLGSYRKGASPVLAIKQNCIQPCYPVLIKGVLDFSDSLIQDSVVRRSITFSRQYLF